MQEAEAMVSEDLAFLSHLVAVRLVWVDWASVVKERLYHPTPAAHTMQGGELQQLIDSSMTQVYPLVAESGFSAVALAVYK
jgi:hypothetical protein